MVEKVLASTGAMVLVYAIIYKAAVKTLLLYGRENWVVTGALLKVLEGFHHRVVRRIVGNTAHRTVDR